MLASGGNVGLYAASLDVSGRTPDGFGGVVFVSSDGDIDMSSRILAVGGGSGSGGEISLEAIGSLTAQGEILARGGEVFPEGEGGTVDVSAGDYLEVSAEVDVSGANSGDIEASCVGPTIVNGIIRARGNRGRGGVIVLAGCSLEVNGDVSATATNGGMAGSLDLRGGAIAVGATGKLLATPCSDSDCGVSLETADTVPTVHPSASIAPTPSMSQNSLIPEC